MKSKFSIGLSSIKEIQQGIQHVIADIIARDKRVADKLKSNV